MTKRIFLDMDGVIVDFVRAALAYHKSDIPITDIQWGIDKRVCNDPKDFWAPMGFDFWANLSWTTEGQILVSNLFKLFGAERISICSTPIETIGSADGKIEWIRKNIPELSRRYNLTPVKEESANPNIILLDDHESNCNKFKKGGGLAILIPRPWNPRKNECDQFGNFCVESIMVELENML